MHSTRIMRLSQPAKIFVAGLLLLHCLAVPALAAENSAEWRPIYDTIMMWVNFGILAFLLYRYLRNPLKKFIQGQQAEVADEIQKFEEQKKEMQEQIQETRQQIENSGARFERIKKRIIEEGEKAKEHIIADARQQSRKMLELEKTRASNRIAQARKQFMSELVDSATRTAQDRLPRELTDEDHRNMLDMYIDNVSRMNG